MISLKVWYNRKWKRKENERTVRMNIKDYERSVPSKNERQTRRSPSTRNQRLVSLSEEKEEESDPQTYDSRRGFHTLSLFLLLLNILLLSTSFTFAPFILLSCHLFNSLVIRVVLVYCVPGTDYSVSLKSREETWRPIIWGDKSDLYFLLRPLLLSSWKVREKPWGWSCLSFSSQEELPSQEEVQGRESSLYSFCNRTRV